MTRYSIVSHRSRVAVEVDSTLRKLELVSTELTGGLEADFLDGRLEAAHVSAWFSVRTQSLESGSWLIDRDVRNMFEVRKFPEIGGELLEIKSGDEEHHYRLRGNLRLHGVTREVQGRAHLVEMGDHHAVFEGEMQLDFTQWNLTPPRLLMLRVEPEVVIRGRVHAERES
jgi:polyisoprenoid-binding protein YceI